MNQEQNQYQKQNSINKKLSTPLGIVIISVLIVAVTGVILAFQYYYFSEKKAILPVIEDSKAESFIQILDKEISEHSFVKIEGKPAPCQPEFFDPKTAELYKEDGILRVKGTSPYTSVNIKEESSGSYNIIEYRFSCGFQHSYVVEIENNNERHALYTHVLEWKLSPDKKYLYLTNNLKKDNEKWELLKRVINIKDKKSADLPNIDCVSLLARWDNDTLITFSDLNYKDTHQIKNLAEIIRENPTEVCLWSKDGNLLYRISSLLSWDVVDRFLPTFQIGLLPEDDDIFYAYTFSFFEEKCFLHLQDLKNHERNRKIKISKGKTNGVLFCHSIEFDFKDFKFDSSIINYRLRDTIGGHQWGEWKTIDI